MSALLSVRNLQTYFANAAGDLPAVDGVSFDLERGQTLGIVGESGCGKSVTSLSIIRLVSSPGRIVGGEVQFHGRDLLQLPEAEMRRIRGNEISMIFQEPMTSLNPVTTVGHQIQEVIKLHQRLNKKAAHSRTVELLQLVGIPAPDKRMYEYPHQMSGGMRQRVMIAMALACNPQLLIADEPTTALDVTIQAQILDLLRRLQDNLGTAIIIITHDLGVIAELADAVAVMYAGKIVEQAKVKTLFARPSHPYTTGLLNSMPRLSQQQERLAVIDGVVPNPAEMPTGCRFHPRCRYAEDICRQKEPRLLTIEPGHDLACWKASDFHVMPEVG